MLKLKELFQNILVVFVTPEHSAETYETAFALAKKFSSKITFLKCIIKPAPTFGFFETKEEKEYHKKDLDEAAKSFNEIKELAAKFQVKINTKVESVDSFPAFLVSYIEDNHVDLAIIDSHSLDKVEYDDHKATINKIYEEISCPLLTLR